MEGLAVKALTESGLAIGFGIAVTLLLFFIVKHILKQQEKIMDMATIQNMGWQKALDEHTAQAKAFHETSSDAHKYQREEHLKCIDGISTVCHALELSSEGNKSFRNFVSENLDVRKKEQEKILIALEGVVNNLKEVSLSLGRINGYTHEGSKGDKGDKGDSWSSGRK